MGKLTMARVLPITAIIAIEETKEKEDGLRRPKS
jgi:hypothetical protein